MTALVTAGPTALVVGPVLVVLVVAVGQRLAARRRAAHLREVVARVVTPPRSAARVGATSPGGWVTTLRYAVDGHAFERVLRLEDRLDSGATVVLQHDVRAPRRSQLAARPPSGRRSWWLGLLGSLVAAAAFGALLQAVVGERFLR